MAVKDEEMEYAALGLSETELAALEADDDVRGDLSALVGDQDDEDDQGDEGDDDKPGDDWRTEERASDANPDQGGEDPPKYVPEPDEPILLPVADVGALKSEQTELEKRAEELRRQFEEDDEISLDEYEKQNRDIQRKLGRIEAKLEDAEANQAKNAEALGRYNDRIAGEIVKAGKKDGIDYTAPKAEAEFNRYFNAVRSDPEFANATLRQVFQEADAMYRARHGIVAGKPGAKPAANSVKDELADRRRRAGGERMPHLAHVPQAGVEADGQGEFSHLDRLSGLDLEKAVARMSPEQQARWAEEAAA